MNESTYASLSFKDMMLAKHRIVLLGAERVGKSSILKRFVNGTFSENYTQTLTDCYQHLIRLPSGLYRNIDILDTGRLNEFPAMLDLSIRSGHAFAVVYAVDDNDSFNAAIDMCNRIHTVKGTDNVRIVLVGNKMDASGSGRLVSTECGLNLASRSLKCAFVETSAKLNLNVSCVFQTLLPEEPQSTVNVSKQRKSKQTDTTKTDTTKQDTSYTTSLTKSNKHNHKVSLRSTFQWSNKRKNLIVGQKKRVL